MNLPNGYMPITIDLHDAYQEYFKSMSLPFADVTFINLWGWAEHYGLGVSFRDKICWICQTKPELRFWAPVGRWSEVDWESQPEIINGVSLFRVPDALAGLVAERLKGRVRLELDRAQWEYLYSREDLSMLPGQAFHKKKNHVNRYLRLYGEDYRPLDSDSVEQVLSLQEDWCRWRECDDSPSLLAENEALFRVMGNWRRLPGIFGGALYVEGSMAAFSVGEYAGDMTVVHFEKARGDVQGGYQAINRFFAAHAERPLINREQDLDEPGLRQAKETYNPVDFIRKSRVFIQGKNN